MDSTVFSYQFSNDLSIFTSGDSSLEEDEDSGDEYRLRDTNCSSLGMFLESADTSAMERPITIGKKVGAENVNLIHNGMLKVDAKQTSKESDHDIPKNIHTGAKNQHRLSDNEVNKYDQELKAIQEFLERYNKNRSSSNDEEVMNTNDYVSYMETNASSPNAVRNTFLSCLQTNDAHLANRLLRDIGIEYIIRHCLVYDGIFTTWKVADSVDGLSTQTSCTNMFWLCSFFGSADVLEIMIEECWIFFVEQETGGAIEPCKEVQDRADNALALLLNYDVESYGCTPLFIAAAQDHASVIKVLLKHKVDPNAANGIGTTAASIAASMDNLAVLEALGEAKDADVDFNQANEDGITPLLAACQYGSVECVRYLTHYMGHMGHASSSTGKPIVNCKVQDKYGLGCTAVAAKHNNYEVVAYFCQINNPHIEVGVNINQVTRDEHNTALHVAAQYNSKEAAKSLLQMIPREIDPLRRNKRGMTALHIAASRGHTEIVKEFVISLRDGMKDLDTADSVGMTPLFYASWKGFKEIVTQLAPLSDTNRLCTVTILKRTRQQPSPVPSLSNQDPSPISTTVTDATNIPSRKTTTMQKPALIAAVNRGHIDIIYTLLYCGADPNLSDHKGDTALSHAARDGQLDIVELLVTQGADPKIRSKGGRLPISRARKNKHFDIVDYLERCT